MPPAHERFLGHRSVVSRKGRLGREYAVTQESWRLSDDPKRVRASTEILSARNTAADAADAAREAAVAYGEHGFHKPSGAWWGSDGDHFHRFVVHAGGNPWPARLLVVSGLLGVTLTLVGRATAGRRSKAGS